MDLILDDRAGDTQGYVGSLYHFKLTEYITIEQWAATFKIVPKGMSVKKPAKGKKPLTAT